LGWFEDENNLDFYFKMEYLIETSDPSEGVKAVSKTAQKRCTSDNQ
jgi:hypothetical protein